MTGYCMSEHKNNREMDNLHPVKMKNGRTGYKGTCSVCGGKMFKIGGKGDK